VDPVGLQAWTNFLIQGHTTSQLEVQLIGSGEYFATRGGSTNNGWLQAVYADVLNRPIDAGGQRAWGQQLSRVSRTTVAGGIINSVEGTQSEVQLLYNQFLHRQADNNGLSNFAAALQQGGTQEQVIANIVASDEYFANF
jgi:hypothetical protein